MSKLLFDDFDAVSAKAWKQKIQLDLKGADYNETLIWNSPEGIDVKPFYHADDFDELPEISITNAASWKICQTIYVSDVEQSNKKALDVLSRGAESIRFIIPSEDVSIKILLKEIVLISTPIHFELLFLSEEFIKKTMTVSTKAEIHVHTDIIGNLAKSGNWYYNLNKDHEILNSVIASSAKQFTSLLSVDVSLYQNAGANMVQQLAYGLAHANEYLNLINNNPSLKVIFEENNLEKFLTFNVSVGTNYFFEIAKLRALRLLFFGKFLLDL